MLNRSKLLFNWKNWTGFQRWMRRSKSACSGYPRSL